MSNTHPPITYTPDVVARNVKCLDNDVIEVKRYNDNSMREMFLVLFVVFLGYWIHIIFIEKDSPLYREMEWAWNAEGREAKLISISTNYRNTKLTNTGEPIEEYKKKLSHRVVNYKIEAYLKLGIPLWLLILAGYPKWRPLRFDPERRIVYTWSFGRFYITRLPENWIAQGKGLAELYPDSVSPMLRYKEHAALQVEIPHEFKRHKRKKIDLGIFRPACPFQDRALYQFLNDYLADAQRGENFAHYFQKESRIASDWFNLVYGFTLFPAWGYNEKRTEKKIQAFLARDIEKPRPPLPTITYHSRRG